MRMTDATRQVGLVPPQITPNAVPPLSILLVEDNTLISQVLADILLELGHAVCGTARTESEAVEAAAQHTPDLVIADVHLARGSGVAAVQKIQRAGHVPHLYMTGGDISLIPAYAATLRKPFSLDDLLRGLASAFDPVRIAAALASREL